MLIKIFEIIQLNNADMSSAKNVTETFSPNFQGFKPLQV
jgi:hypothetical protein